MSVSWRNFLAAGVDATSATLEGCELRAVSTPLRLSYSKFVRVSSAFHYRR